MNMGKRIQTARQAKGYKQEYVAQALGVSRQAVSKWETGQTHPDTGNLIALSTLLDVSVDYLTRGDQPLVQSPSSKSESLKRISLLLLTVSAAVWALGFFSGAYSTMLFLPLSDSLSIGIPFIWYGKTGAAIAVKVIQLSFFVLALLVRLVAWATENSKQALS